MIGENEMKIKRIAAIVIWSFVLFLVVVVAKNVPTKSVIDPNITPTPSWSDTWLEDSGPYMTCATKVLIEGGSPDNSVKTVRTFNNGSASVVISSTQDSGVVVYNCILKQVDNKYEVIDFFIR